MHDIHVDISLKIREKKSGSTEFWNVTEDGGQILTSIFFFYLVHCSTITLYLVHCVGKD